MSWLVVFISSFVPIVLLFILLIMDWLHGEPRSKLSSLRLWGGMREKDRRGWFADSTRYAAIPLRASPSKTRMRLGDQHGMSALPWRHGQLLRLYRNSSNKSYWTMLVNTN